MLFLQLNQGKYNFFADPWVGLSELKIASSWYYCFLGLCVGTAAGAAPTLQLKTNAALSSTSS